MFFLKKREKEMHLTHWFIFHGWNGYFTRKLMSRRVDRIRSFFRLSCRSPSCKGFWSEWSYRLWSRFRCRSTWKNFENLCVNGPPTRLMSESLNYIVANVISWKCSKLARHLFPIICLFDFNWLWKRGGLALIVNLFAKRDFAFVH